jgi:hypothetical protein
MTTNENTDRTISPLAADIFTAMAKQSEWTTNQVLDNKDREIKEWKQRFLMLFEAVENANIKADSLSIDHVLMTFSHNADTAARNLDSH